jgi:PAS domain S-box-containing protein
MPVRVLIVDDHEPVRRGIRSLLTRREDWSVCGEAADGVEATEMARQLQPDVILMDISMPRMDGVEATRIIRQEVPQAEVIIVTHNDPALVSRQAAESGATGYVSKAALARDLLPAILKIIGRGEEAESPERREDRSAQGQWLFGGGDLGHLIREYDWSATSLGPIQEWPQCLKTAVNLMLNSQHPIWIGWGPEMTFLYNDAYISVLSLAKHPSSLGRPAREVWAEIWDVCGPLADKVFTKAEPSFANDVRLFMSRGEYLEETYYSFSYSPIYDESGKVAGLFCPSAETTAKILHARQLRTLSELSAKALVEKSVHAACVSSIEIISQNPDDMPFSLLYLLDDNCRVATLAGTSHVLKGIDSVSPLEIDVNVQGSPSLWPLREVVEGSRPRLVGVDGVDSLPLGAAQRPVTEALVLPLTSATQSRPFALLIVGVNPTRKLDREYSMFFSLIADQVATAIQNATAVEQEKKRTDALAELDRAKMLFFSNVSHEFRTPLTLMLGPLEDMLSESAALSIQHREKLDLAHRNSVRLLKLVNTLLDFSRIESGRSLGTCEPTDLGSFTAELACVFQSTVERAGLRFIVNCEAIEEPVYVDREMWEEIVFNLLSNAFKFTFAGEIETSLRNVGDFVELSIRDTGIGIPAEELPHVFERFHRVKGARGRTIEGSGIGLALVKELAKLHGATVRVESQLDIGTKFTLAMPKGKGHLPPDRLEARRTAPTAFHAEAFVEEAMLWLPEAAAARTQKVDSLAQPRSSDAIESKKARVLIADDNADMREYLTRLLRVSYEVEAVGDGQAALEAAQKNPPDLIVTDVMMPNLDGFGLLRKLRADSRIMTIPVIVLSARAGEESRVVGAGAGADDYLEKPFSARQLAARVETHLRLARVRREAEIRERSLRMEAERNERQLRAIIDTTPDWVKLVSPNGTLLHINKSGLEMIEADSADMVIGKNIYDLIAPEDRERYREFNERVCRGQKDSLEFDVIGLKGSRRQMETHAAPLRQPDGTIIQLGVTLDVTERNVSGRSSGLLAAIVDSSDDAIVSKDLNGVVTSWNKGAERIFGYTAQEAIGKNIKMIIPPDRFDEEADILARLKRGERVDHFETVRKRKDGVLIDISVTISPIRDTQGRVTGASKVARDITAQKRAEERERQITAEGVAATAKFRAVFEQTTVFAGIMTKDGILIEANKLCLDACGYRAEDVLGRLFWEAPWWRNFKEAQDKICAATPLAAQGIPYRETLLYSWADGTERIVDFALYPIVDDKGQVLFLHPTAVDITDLKRAEENYRLLVETLDAEVRERTRELEERTAEVLEQSQQLRELSWQLLQTQDEERRHIARELHDSAGQTLVVLGMNLATIVRAAKNKAPEITKSAQETQELVQQLSKEIRTTSYLLHPPLLDETGLPAALSWYVQGLMERSGLDITLNISEKVGRLPREIEMVLFRVVQECLTNVHRHSGSKTAAIDVSRAGNKVLVEICDQGRGIPAEHLAKIQSKSTGVGIRGMRERLRQFHGELTIDSTARGTRVLVTIPGLAANTVAARVTG